MWRCGSSSPTSRQLRRDPARDGSPSSQATDTVEAGGHGVCRIKNAYRVPLLVVSQMSACPPQHSTLARAVLLALVAEGGVKVLRIRAVGMGGDRAHRVAAGAGIAPAVVGEHASDPGQLLGRRAPG